MNGAVMMFGRSCPACSARRFASACCSQIGFMTEPTTWPPLTPQNQNTELSSTATKVPPSVPPIRPSGVPMMSASRLLRLPTPVTWRTFMTAANRMMMTAPGIRAAKERPTASGTPFGILIVKSRWMNWR